VHQGKCYDRVILVISSSGTDISCRTLEHWRDKIVVLIPNRVSQEATQLIHAWFIDNTLKVKITQVGWAGRAKRKGNIKIEQLLAISIMHVIQYRMNIVSITSDG